ncbi:MAG TPA: DUF2269 family protein [Candidatus Dormibacteraeota bacterium]|nr:DUF2269 family protein [Candidatus Dormibacteraeota bacterium]
MFTWYLVLKYIHIFSAIVAVGSNITYAVWSVRAQGEPSHFAFAFKGIKFIDDRLANPAYGVLFLTGLIMVFAGNWGFKLWVVAAIVLFVAVAAIGFGYFTPLLRNQIKLAEAGETSSPEFERGLRRNQVIGPLLGVLVAIILVLMVFKPTL